ncbi:hypothetical protein HZC32_02295 [Candidatus Woesearchaeota archaeon]|nr:hypothetical protein [Candidatus Woesearchaeota archaeon]
MIRSLRYKALREKSRMSLLDEIKREKSKAKEEFQQPLFYRLAYLLSQNNSSPEVKDEIRSHELRIKSMSELKEKPHVEVPPFYLPDQPTFYLAQELEQYANPYFEFANSAEEISPAIGLWELNPALDKKLLETHHFQTLLAREIARQLLPGYELRRANLVRELEELHKEKSERASKKLAQAFGMEARISTKKEFNKWLDYFVDIAKQNYVEQEITKELGLSESVGFKQNKLELTEIKPSILKKLRDSRHSKSVAKHLGITPKELKIAELFDSLEGLVETKFNRLVEKISQKSEDTTSVNDKEFKVGDDIIMNAQASGIYSCTRQGSEGRIIKHRGHSEWSVEFSKLTGDHWCSLPHTFEVEAICMEKKHKGSCSGIIFNAAGPGK